MSSINNIVCSFVFHLVVALSQAISTSALVDKVSSEVKDLNSTIQELDRKIADSLRKVSLRHIFLIASG